MPQLIKQNRNGKEYVSARELHKLLGVKRNFTTWIKDRINKYGFLENKEYTVIEFIPQNNIICSGTNMVDYALTIDLARSLCLLTNNKQSYKIREYLSQQEYIAALKALIRREERRLML